MKKYYYALVDKFYDKRYENILSYSIGEDSNYLKNVVESHRVEKNFLGIKIFAEYLDKFPIIVETTEDDKITDIITGEVYYALPNKMDYRGESELVLYLGSEIPTVKVAEELRRLLPGDVERYKTFMEKLKETANRIKNEERKKTYALEQLMVKEEQDAQEFIEDFTNVYRRVK